ncbi:MAG: hypothetical protein FJ134_05495 [Deltaproteobacteria bacterium]|nr:hypothetical protein [Deltaproteobacteria bacterium]
MIDAHAHLNEIQDITGAVQRANEAGITAIIAVGMDLSSNQHTMELARRFPGIVHPAVGYHPWSLVELERVKEITTANTRRFFGI